MLQNCYKSYGFTHKATGPADSILANKLLKIAPLLTLICKTSVDQGKLPGDSWKLTYITPIFKKGNRRSAVNYQPISLTSICCKLLEHILHSSTFKHLETLRYYVNNNLVSEGAAPANLNCLVPFMTLQHISIMMVTLMPCFLTWLRPLTKSFTSVYVQNHHIMELRVIY